MKNFLATVAVFATFATTASAETVKARITQIEPRYETVYQNVTRTECYNVEVPVYGQTQSHGANGGDVLAGMIIGGLIGKGVTGDDGGAAAGAVLGGVIAADKKSHSQVITGYRTQRQCNEVLVNEPVRQLKNYFVYFKWNGMQGTAYTYNHYNVGDYIYVEVSLRAK